MINIRNKRIMAQSMTYITPRLVVVHDLQEASQRLKSVHGNYFYLFNLSQQDDLVDHLFPSINVRIKNRGFPFSLKSILQLCMQLQRYFYKGVSNTVAFYCPDNSMGVSAIICYMYTSGRFRQMKDVMEYFLTKLDMELPNRWLLNFEELFDNMRIVMPPVKILKRVVLESEEKSVPVFEVFRESRFEELESVYNHPILQDLQQHQHHLLSAHYHTKKPNVTYLFKPVPLSGDFRIDLYTYKQLKQQNILSIGFNTLFVDTDTIVFEGSDLVENRLSDPNLKVTLEFEDYCGCGSEVLHSNRCLYCVEELKNIKKEYNELIDLSCQFNRNRKKDVASRLVFGNQKFDDAKPL